MSKFQFPYTIKLQKPLKKVVPKDKKYICDGINILEYVTEDEVQNADNIIVFTHKLNWYKGILTINPDMIWDTVTFTIKENPERKISGKNLYISWIPDYIWDFNDITTGYTKEKNQYFIRVELTEDTNEMDVLGLASGLSHLYGYKFIPHTINDIKRIYEITMEKECDSEIGIFTEISKYQKDILKARGLWTDVRVNHHSTHIETQSYITPDKWEW